MLPAELKRGHDARTETIAWYLRRQGDCAPPISTIWRILSRRGFVTAQPHKRPRASWRRSQAGLPNELWRADITYWPLTDGSDADILNMVDDHSRLLAGCTACRVFTGLYCGRGRVALERELTALGIGFGH